MWLWWPECAANFQWWACMLRMPLFRKESENIPQSRSLCWHIILDDNVSKCIVYKVPSTAELILFFSFSRIPMKPSLCLLTLSTVYRKINTSEFIFLFRPQDFFYITDKISFWTISYVPEIRILRGYRDLFFWDLFSKGFIHSIIRFRDTLTLALYLKHRSYSQF